MAKKTTLDDVAKSLSQQGEMLSQHGKEIRDLTNTLTHVVKHMATKEDFAEIRAEVSEIRNEVLEIRSVMVTQTQHEAFRQESRDQFTHISRDLVSINRRLDKLEEQVGDLKGFAVEIDDIRARVKDIEKHLGLNKKIAA